MDQEKCNCSCNCKCEKCECGEKEACSCNEKGCCGKGTNIESMTKDELLAKKAKLEEKLTKVNEALSKAE